jgi:phosphatidylinositol alpha-1,6-mannosyltransferase
MALRVRVLHVLDHSIPLHSGYTFRTLAILREQRRRGWETFHLTSPKRRRAAAGMGALPVLNEWALMRHEQRLLRGGARVRPHLLHAHSPVLNALAGAAGGP